MTTGTVLRPASTREAAAVLGGSTGSVTLRGGATKQTWLAAAEVPPDLLIDTTGLDAPFEHSSGDMIAVVGAGVPIAALQEHVAEAGQRLALDPPSAADGATVGGVYAADEAGPWRLRYGTMRDLAIGVTAVLADGTVAHAGGRVVKNVAGFDLVRLLCGSLGTLALVSELVVRLHPLPEASVTLRLPATASEATRLALALLAAPLAPTAVEWFDGALWVLVEGRPAGVRAQAAAVALLAAGTLPGAAVEQLDGDEQAAAWRAVRGAQTGVADETLARAAALPGQISMVVEAVRTAAGREQVGLVLTASPGVGAVTARLSPGTAGAHAAVIRAWRHALADMPATVVVRRRAPQVEGLVDPWLDPALPAPQGLAIMRRVKAQLDPVRRLAPGRYLGGI